MTKLWVVSVGLLAAMWLDYSLGTPVWPLRDMIHCSLGLVLANLAAVGVFCWARRRDAA